MKKPQLNASAPCHDEVFKGMDACKLVASWLIVVLHVTETSALLPQCIKFVCTSFAVPFFFMASGFFFARGIHARPAEQQGSYMKKYFSHLLLTYVVWALIICLPFTVYSYFTLPKYADSSIWYIVCVLLRKLFIVGPGPYWYLVALMGSVVVLYTLRRSYICIACLVALCLALLMCYTSAREFASQFLLLDMFCQGIEFLYSWEYNFLTFGIPFCGIGFLAYSYKWNIPAWVAVLLFALFSCVKVFEYFATEPAGELKIFFIPQAVCFFFFALNWKLPVSVEVSRTCRQLSSFIYFAHFLLLENILNPLLNSCGVSYTFAPVAILPKTILIILLCGIIFLVLRKRRNAFCKILING